MRRSVELFLCALVLVLLVGMLVSEGLSQLGVGLQVLTNPEDAGRVGALFAAAVLLILSLIFARILWLVSKALIREVKDWWSSRP